MCRPSDWDLGVCLQYECRRKQIHKPDVLNSWIDLRSTYRVCSCLLFVCLFACFDTRALYCLHFPAVLRQETQRPERCVTGSGNPVCGKRALRYLPKPFAWPRVNPRAEPRADLVCRLLRFGRCQKYGSVGSQDDERRVRDEGHQEPERGEWPASGGASQLLTSHLSGSSGPRPGLGLEQFLKPVSLNRCK